MPPEIAQAGCCMLASRPLDLKAMTVMSVTPVSGVLNGWIGQLGVPEVALDRKKGLTDDGAGRSGSRGTTLCVREK